jgi:gliding motility-associated-like protein
MLTSWIKGSALLVLSIICCYNLHGQLPTSNLLYMRSPTGTDIYNYDPTQPVSATNPSVNTIQLPTPPGHGLAICEVLGSGNSILTFYTIINDRYWYYDPFTSAWVNTHNLTGSNGIAVNFGGGGGFIYNFDAIGGNLYKYDGTGDGSLLLDIPGYGSVVGAGGVADVVVDCEGNWFIMLLFHGNNVNSYLRKYNPAGILLQAWTINNPNNFSSGPGFGIVNDTIYLINQITNPTGLSIPSASLGSGTIDFSTNPALLPISTLNDDMASAPASSGAITPTISITTPDNPVCPGTAVTFTSVISNGGNSPGYQWFVNGVAIAAATNASFSFTPHNEDIVTCQLVRTAPSCNLKATVLSNAVTMNVLSPEVPVFQYNTNVFCKNAGAGVPVYSPAGGTFSASSEGLAIDINTGIIDPVTSNTGTYIVTYIPVVPAAGCKLDSIRDTITIVPLPVAHISTLNDLDDLCLNDALSLFATHEPDCIYEWKPADYFPDGNSGVNVTARAISSGAIYLSAINSAGCINTDTILMKAKPCCDVFLPNAFSPDNDGLNDVFKMYSKSSMQQAISFTIYNRWGQKIFFTSDLSDGWNGIYNGNPADAGVYFYYLHYTCSDGTEKTLNGEVTLIR